MVSLDCVTVAFSGELNLLKLQARSLARFAPDGLFDRIHIVINDKKPQTARRAIERDVLPEYGSLAPRVVVHMADQSAKVGLSGWRSQQVAKLLIARQISAPVYVTLDCKNHFIRSISRSDFIDAESGKPITLFRSGDKLAMRDAMATSFDWVGAPPPACDLVLAPPVTPFTLITDQVRALLDDVEKTRQTGLAAAFAARRGVTEFYSYQGWLLRDGGTLEDHYAPGATPKLTFFSQDHFSGAHWRYRDGLMDDANIYCIALHRRVLGSIPEPQRRRFVQLWRDRGLLAADEPDDMFLRADLPPRTIWQRLGARLGL